MMDRDIATLREQAGLVLARLLDRELRSATVVSGAPGGMHRGLRRGGGVEFAEHREYSPGDDLRHLDWRAWARNDRFYIKRYEQEVHASITLLLDASASMAVAPTAGVAAGVDKLAAVRLLVAILAAMVVRQGDAVGLMIAGRPHLNVSPAGGEAQLLRVIGTLLRAAAEGEGGLETLGRAALRDVERCGVVIALSDVLTDPGQAMAPLAAMARLGPRVALLQTLHPLELTLGFDEPVELVCGERGRRQIVDPRVVRRAYIDMMSDHCAAVRKQATAAGVHHLVVDLGTDPAAHIGKLLSLLSARGGRMARVEAAG